MCESSSVPTLSCHVRGERPAAADALETDVRHILRQRGAAITKAASAHHFMDPFRIASSSSVLRHEFDMHAGMKAVDSDACCHAGAAEGRAMKTARRCIDDVAFIGREERNTLDQIIRLAFEHEPQLTVVEMKVPSIGVGRSEARLRRESTPP